MPSQGKPLTHLCPSWPSTIKSKLMMGKSAIMAMSAMMGWVGRWWCGHVVGDGVDMW